MNMLKLTAAAALVAASLSASAMSSINDDELSTVSGQDGVSIAANLNINIGSFTYSENNSATTGGAASVSFNNIQIGRDAGKAREILKKTGQPPMLDG